MRFGAQDGNIENYQVRNVRNPTKITETCINNVGSFYCASTEEEYIGEWFEDILVVITSS